MGFLAVAGIVTVTLAGITKLPRSIGMMAADAKPKQNTATQSIRYFVSLFIRIGKCRAIFSPLYNFIANMPNG